MKAITSNNVAALALVYALAASTAQAQQVPIPQTAAEVPGPAAGNTMTKQYVQMVGRMAYFWGWPLVANANRAVAFSKVPEPGLVGGVVPIIFHGDGSLPSRSVHYPLAGQSSCGPCEQ
jgi:hypothetical protein